MAPVKRKRLERVSVDSGENRPSPHRPGNTNLGQHDRGDSRDGSRRSSRGGQGMGGVRGGGRRNDGRDNSNRDNLNKLTVSAGATPTPGPMSPPPRPSSAAQTPTSTYEFLSPTIPKRDPAPYDYVFLTDERIASWDTSGRQEVVAASTQARRDEDTMDLSSVFQELIRATLDGRISPSDGGNCVKEILGPNLPLADGLLSPFDAETFFLDTLSIMFDAEEHPFNPTLKQFAFATGVSPAAMRQKLDAQLLQNLGLTRDTFIRVGIRQATHLLYRQSNYNLLREETEGYSKLATELFTSSGGNSRVESISGEFVEDAFERVKALIGTFDLDVGRVLDITLDVFAALLIKQYRFFVKLLRVSSWWPRNSVLENVGYGQRLPVWAMPGANSGMTLTEEEEALARKQRAYKDSEFWGRAREVGLDAFFEIGGGQVLDAETKARILASKGDSDAELDADRNWIEETGTFPPSGNRIAAQLLGFKLRFYASAARDKEDILPANLMYLAALLIKIGFISLKDLYPHLWPLDEDMPAVREAREKELAEKEKLARGGASNALTLAGALVDDTLPNGGRTREVPATKIDSAPTAEAEIKDKIPEPSDQKIQLLKCLLTIGAIPEALFILGRFPWLPELYPDLVELINRILAHSLKDVYELARPVSSIGPVDSTKKVTDSDQSGMPKGQVRLNPIVRKKPLRWPYPDKHENAEFPAYKFYWDEWAENVPVCQNVDDIFTLCSTLLNLSGVNIGRDASLLSKFARIGVMSLSQDTSPENLSRWQDLLKRLLVPALSLTKSNTSVVNEIYDMLRFYPVSIRYSIYSEWFEGQISRLPAMKVAFARTKVETLGIMKRISMTNLTAMARNLAKAAYASPGIVFGVALSQIEAYNNLTDVVVECAKYFTDLGYDVLVWSLLSALGAPRNRNNAEFALLPSKWLKALSQFAGRAFKRYSIMNLSPILQFVNEQLYNGIPTDLVILQQLMAQMAGVVPDTDYTDLQIIAMTGGQLLRRQTLISLYDKRYESTKTAKRLMKALTETKLAGQLLLSIAQHKQSAIYRVDDSNAHVKFLATMIDDAQLILFQYLDLLRSNMEVEEFDKHVPSIPELMTDFGLEPALAFMIGRASLTHRMAQITLSQPNGASKTVHSPPASTIKTDADGDTGMDENSEAHINGDAQTTEDTQMPDAQASSPKLSPITNLATDPIYDIMQPVISAVQNLLPENAWNAMSPDIYVTFWTSTMSDLSVPLERYEIEIKRLSREETLLISDRSDTTRAALVKKEETRKALAETRDALQKEMKKTVDDFKSIKARVLKGKAGWFKPSVKADFVSDAFLEKCLVPRLLLSPSDADYSFKMVRFLHDAGTPNFRTLSLYGRIFKTNRLRSIIFTCSVREAGCLGRFLRHVLTDLQKWHSDPAVYELEAWGKRKNLPGFAKALDIDGTPKGLLDHDGDPGFKNILLAWHKNLNSALRDCLEGMEFMHIRNAITILKELQGVYPVIDFMGNGFIKQLEALTAREKDVREDLSLTGNAVLVQLKKRSRNWIMVQAFGYNLSKPANVTSPSQSRTNTPKTNLKPTAPEFKPQSRASSLGVSTPKISEVEDGEVDDAKTTRATRNAPLNSNPPAPTAQLTTEPKKSEILVRREQILRENAAKLTSSQLHSNAPTRTDRLTPAPNLPSRPDAPFPSRQQLDRHRHSDRRDGREPRLADSVRMERPGDRPREYPASDRRGENLTSRDFGRPSDRNSGSDRDRVRPEPPPRWNQDSSRENLERGTNVSRANDSSGRLSRESGMPPPRSSGTSSDRGPAVNLERLSQVAPERPDIIDPGRAALISSDIRSESPRQHRDELRDRPSPRNPSPRRFASDRDHSDSRRDDRPSRNGAAEVNVLSRGRNEDAVPPAGPRNDRPVDRVNERNDRSALAFQPTQAPQRPVDPDHGRLNSSSRQPADPNFGRLNAAPATPEIPLGPRDRNIRGNRLNSGPRRDGRMPTETPRLPTPEKQLPPVTPIVTPTGPPTGPSSGRLPRRSASGQFDTPSMATGSAPSTPTIGQPAVGIHPDRLRHLGSQVPQSSHSPLAPHTTRTPHIPHVPHGPHGSHGPHGPHSSHVSQTIPSPAAAAAVGIHPDRLRAFGNDVPMKPQIPANQINNNRSRPPIPSVVTGGPPLGPKGNQASPITPSSNGMAPPTGPASATERALGPRRQLAGINTMLQQAGQQNGSDRNVRGRGRMSVGGLQDNTPISSPSIAVPPPPPPPPPSGRPAPRDGGRDLLNPERVDLFNAPEAANDEREKDRSGSRRERSGRHSRRSSRSPRDSKRVPVEEERSSRSEHRDRRGGDREADRDRHQGRSPHRDLLAGREAGGNSREGGRERDRESHGRREGREREPVEVPWNGEGRSERSASGRSRDMRGEARGGGEERGRSNREDSGRKRRSDEGMVEARGHAHDKRPRRV